MKTLILLLSFLPAIAQVQTGADRLFEQPYLSWIQGKRVGLITNQTGIDRQFQSTIDRLSRQPGVELTAIFAPEHGIQGSRQAGRAIERSGRIYSLYGAERAPTPEMLRDVDVLLYDIQDVGCRFYTFTSTLLESMKAAARSGIPLIVLDRPDPIGGNHLEGPPVEAALASFVGIEGLPIRYGLTPGELAGMLNKERQLGCRLKIVPLKGWRRGLWFDQTGLAWILPSPNMPTLGTATVYPGLCLIEGTNLSEGRGTTRPFELVGAPWLRSGELAERLNRLHLPGVRFRPQSFVPSFSKYRGEACQGVQIHVLNRNLFRPVETALHLLAAVRKLHPRVFEFSESFDRLAGNSWIRPRLSQGLPVEQIIRKWQHSLREFEKKRKLYLLYP
ncbi:MAG: exo-beta-N-acetylmuramidase NamZ domain-containing protein [Acidobacteriota bacterium]